MSRLDPALFVGEQPVPEEITLADGTKHTFHFRELLASRLAQYHDELGADDPKVADKAQARLLADGVCMPDGGEALTEDEAYRLKPKVLTEMRKAIFRVNGLTTAAKNV